MINFFINLCYTSYTTKFGLKVGLYEVSSFFSCDVSNWITFEQLLGVRINGIVYGDTTYLVTCITDPIKISKNFDLFQNYPNPFNPITTIKYSTIRTEGVKIEVFNLLGEKIATLINEEKPAVMK